MGGGIRGVGRGVGRVSGGVEASEDIDELGKEDFLEADDGGGDVVGVEAEGGEEEGEAGGPGLFAAEWGRGGVADVVG